MKKFGVLATVVALGCGGSDDGTGSPTELKSDEARGLAQSILNLSLDFGLQNGLTGSQAQAAPPIDLSFTVDASPSCPQGGEIDMSMSVDGTIDTDTQQSDLRMTLGQIHRNCQVTDPETNTRFTLNGDPSLNVIFDISVDGAGGYSVGGSYTGGIAWATGDRAGSCGVNLTFSGSGNASNKSVSASLTGSFCGQPLDFSFSS